MQNARMNYFFIRVTNVGIFNRLVNAAENLAAGRNATFEARRHAGFYELVTHNRVLWHELYIYGQMLAQAQDENIDGGEATL